MKHFLISFLALVWALAPASAMTEGDGTSIVGDWHGAIQAPAGPLTVIVTLTESDSGALEATFQVPAQAPGVQIPTTELSFDGVHLRFRVPRAAATYEGRWLPEQRRFEGTFTQGIEMALILKSGLPPDRAVIEGLDGTWHGTLERNGTALRLALNVETTEAGTIATLDSPDMGATGLPVTEFARNAGLIRFKVPVASVSYRAELNEDRSRMCGPWTRPGRPEATVCFERQAESSQVGSEPLRPQEPAGDLPYQSVDIRFRNPQAGGIELAGTLTLPDGKGPFPAAVLISGSGPQDRDESFMGHKPFLVLADYLTRQGIAVLRYDDRGYGKSGGDHWAATTADFATDASAAVNWLKQRTEIDPRAIGLIGHSEGGLVAPITAGENSTVAWVVLLAAPGVDMLELVASQTEIMARSQGASDAELARVMPVNRRIWQIIAETGSTTEARTSLDEFLTPEVLQTLGTSVNRKPVIIETSLRPWLRYLLQFDPAPHLNRLQVPVLALNGSLDKQVPAQQNLPAIQAALARNPDATVTELSGLNHLFQTARTGAIGEYRDIEETFAPKALALVADWINQRF